MRRPFRHGRRRLAARLARFRQREAATLAKAEHADRDSVVGPAIEFQIVRRTAGRREPRPPQV